jgi:hypothetical protein
VGIGQTGQTIALEPSAPQQDRHLVDRQVGRNPLVGRSFGCGKNDLGTHHQTLLGRACSKQGLERGSL